MRINDKLSIQAGSTGPAQQVNGKPADAARGAENRAGGAAASTPAVKVELSSRSRELQAALQAASNAPDVRTDLVDKVKDQIAKGTYEVDPARIARGILDIEA